MDDELFDSDMLESCRLDDERELRKAFYLPSLEEIAAMKRQIRVEKDAKEGLKVSPPYKIYRQPRVNTASATASAANTHFR